MFTILGYQITETIHTSNKTRVYRGYHEADRQPVILKTVAPETAEAADLARLQHEYAITQHWVENQHPRTYALLDQQNTQVLVLHDIGGVSLEHLLTAGALPVTTFLSLALAFAQCLNQIHEQQLIHKDINPTNLVVNMKTGEVQIIDFGISSRLSQETTALQNPGHLEGTLAYLSPEQTGRMNRALDYRTDFYSLGATFYKMLTGRAPFVVTDPMALVHCHLAKMPPPIQQLNPQVPLILNELVNKLMAKTPEARYQSAFGLIADLTNCQNNFQAGDIPEFVLGQQDISGRFQIPQKLFGRQHELTSLLDAFARTSQGAAEILMVAGYSGVGKTALVHEVYKPVTEKQAYFISGKFDQFQRDIPYASLIQAFQELIRQLLTESPAQINRWKYLLEQALKGNAQVIIDVIPEVEWIMGPQPQVPDLPPLQAQNRFNLTLQKFIGTFATAKRALVLFLDDLQWADLPSLQVLELFMSTPETQYLLIIGAYRDNEVPAAHPLMLTLEAISKTALTSSPPLTLKLQPLAHEHIAQLLAETLHCEPKQCEPLAALCLLKTHGNPFFLNQFLRTLVETRQILFNHSTGRWQWDIAILQKTQITGNVVELMADKIRTLPPETQGILELAACIGNQFDLHTLAFVCEKTPLATAQTLWRTLQENLIVPLDETYRYMAIEGQHTSNSNTSTNFHASPNHHFRFIHDRVQQAAYSLIADQTKAIFHLRIGRLLLANFSPTEREERIFDLLYHWNQGQALLTLPEEKEALAQMNLTAGKKAKASAAYMPALNYLQTGLRLADAQLHGTGWKNHYELSRSLSVEAAEAAYFSGDFEQMTHLSNTVLQHARTIIERVKIHQIQIQACILQNQLKQAIQIALPVLKALGMTLPTQPKRVHVLRDLLVTKWVLAGKTVTDLEKLPEMSAAIPLATIQILGSINPAAYLAMPELLPMTIFKSLQLSVKYGNCGLSAFNYAAYGALMCGVLNEIEEGQHFGELAASTLAAFPSPSLKTKINFVLEGLIKHWKHPLQDRQKPLLEVYQNGVQNGDFEYASYAAHTYCYILFFLNHPLTELQVETAKFAQAMHQFKQGQILLPQTIIEQTIANLRGLNDKPSELCGNFYNSATSPIAADNRTAMVVKHFYSLILCYVFHDYETALEHAQIIEPGLENISSNLAVPMSHFYMALTRLAIHAQTPPSGQAALLKKVAAIQKKIKKWAYHAPCNYLNKWHLVEAERARVAGKDLAAMRHYEQAIALAKENNFLLEVALGNELAARFYFAKEQDKIAGIYLQEAYENYRQWGAHAKLAQIEAHYPALFTKALSLTSKIGAVDITQTTASRTQIDSTRILASERLDIATVLKATQAISGEIVLGQLLEKMMRIAIENAGAQHGFLLLETNGQWHIEAEGNVNQETVQVLQSHTLMPSADAENPVSLLPVSIIQYVAMSKKAILLDNACERGRFIHDQTIIQGQIKSVLCAPILYQCKLAGILYLENRLVEGAFTTDRLDVLQILSSQAAISIENARIYENLESTVTQRTAALTQSNVALSEAVTVAQAARQQAETAEQKATQALDELRAAQTNLIQSERMASLGTLTAGVAHEINNPINFAHVAAQIQRTELKGFEEFLMDLLQEDPDPEISAEFRRRFAKLQENVGLMLNGTERIKHIVKDLRSFTRPDGAEKTWICLSECLNATLNLVRASWLEKVEFITEYADDPPYECWPALLNQVFMNLMVNACQAIAVQQEQTGSTEKGKLWLRLRLTPSELVVEVADNGSGIEAEILPRILEPFFTTKDVGSGTGLGLSISYGIIQKHQATLSIDSKPGMGSCFAIHFPCSQ